MKKQIRIPTILGILLTLLGLLAAAFLIKQTTGLLTRVHPEILPKNLLLTNLSDTKFTVSFITDEETLSFLKYGISPSLSEIATNDKDTLRGKNEPSTLHYITVSNLKPDTAYYFKIEVGKKIYGAKNNSGKISFGCLDFLEISPAGNPFSLKTLSSKTISCRDVPLNGEIVTTQKLPAYGAIVCIEINNLLPISDYVKSNGKWVIPCYNLAAKDGLNFSSKLSDGEKETIYIKFEKGDLVKVTNKTGNDNPVPLIALGQKNYDFTKSILIAPINIPTKGLLQEENQPIAAPTISPLILTSPQGEISDNLPTFRGKGKPNQVLKIEVRSEEPLSATVVVDENGNWSWTPPKNLLPGEHTVTITTTDEYGNQQLITRVFTISGSNPLLPITSGTQSGQLTVTPTLSFSPTITLSPTPFEEELSPSPTTSPSGTLMNTANEIPMLGLLTFAIISFTLGLRLIFKKK